MLVGDVGGAVGPVLLHGAVEPFGFAVLPGAVRPGGDVLRAERLELGLERGRDGVVLRVVGHDLADRDPVAGEELGRGGEERRAGGALLIGEDLREREPGVVIDGDVDVVEPELDLPIPAAVMIDRVWTCDAPTAAFGDAAELPHVDVDQVPRGLAFVADLGASGRAQRDPGDRVQLVQRRKARSGDQPGCGAWTDPAGAGDLVASEPLARAQLDDRGRCLRRCRGRRRCWARGTVRQPCFTEIAVTGQPAVCALPGHAHLFRDVRDGPAGEDTANEDQPARDSEPRITVDQEKASTSVTLDTTNRGGLLPTRLSTTC